MENNINNGTESNIENGTVNVEKSAAETQAQEVRQESKEQTQNAQSQVYGRKNGRNKSGFAKATGGVQNQAPSCGMVEDIASAAEKLSGRHIKGYERTESRKLDEPVTEVETKEKVSAFEAADETPAAETVEEVKTEGSCSCEAEGKCDCESESACECEGESRSDEEESSEEVEGTPVHKGPEFDVSRAESQAVEVSLSDRRPAFRRDDKRASDLSKAEVSYSDSAMFKSDDGSEYGLFAKIKRFFARIFGGKKSEERGENKNLRFGKGGKKFHNKNFKKRYSDRREGGERREGGRDGERREGDRREGGNRPYRSNNNRFSNNRRPHNNNNNNNRRPNNGGRPGGAPKSGE